MIENRTQRFMRRKLVSTGILHIVLVLFSLSLCLPFVWMALTGFKTLEEIGLDSWIPAEFHWSNYGDVFHTAGIQFGRWYWNSLFIAAAVTFLQVLTSSLAAFSFARLKWPGRDKVFLLYLGTMMLPWVVMMVPNYQLMIKLGIVDSYWGLIIPASFSAFGTFLLRQFMLGIPASLDEAAEIDGASKWQLCWDVILPLARPGMITLAIFTFIPELLLAPGDDEERAPLHPADRSDVLRLNPGAADQPADGGHHHVGGAHDRHLRVAAAAPGAGNSTGSRQGLTEGPEAQPMLISRLPVMPVQTSMMSQMPAVPKAPRTNPRKKGRSRV